MRATPHPDRLGANPGSSIGKHRPRDLRDRLPPFVLDPCEDVKKLPPLARAMAMFRYPRCDWGTNVYRYPCPGCRSTNVLHGRECQFDDRSRTEIERVHTSIIATLSTGPASPSTLRERTIDAWDDLHESTLRMLRRDARVELDPTKADTGLVIVPPDEIADRLEPTDDPLRTIYEHGSVPGAHDNSVFAMVSYYASKGLSWEDTKRQVVKWLHESGTWDRGGFEEPSPEVLVEDKRHVHREGYGWLEKAKAAKRVIDDSHLVEG